MDDPKIEVHQSTISTRWAYYINGERRGSAQTKADAERMAQEIAARIKRDGR